MDWPGRREGLHVAGKIGTIYKMLLAVLIIIPAVMLGGLMYLYSLQPKYSGQLPLAGLQAEVEVIFDPYGIPHIYGRSQEDVYLALGYIHARERLFQMEMMRRVAAGRLSEILGKELVATDKFFRTIGLLDSAEKYAARSFINSPQPVQKAALAYLEGVNQFIERGPTPIEFKILGIPKEKFTPKDIYLTAGLMAFGFATGFQQDPLVTKAFHKLGWKYLKDWVLDWHPTEQKIPVYGSNYAQVFETLGDVIHRITANLPVPRWVGSNGWVVSGKKTRSGAAIFANDTHMEYSQPSVWYEAHLEGPGFSFYGNHAAGLPFGIIGHNRFMAWGLTMFENDDVDFYKERVNPDNPDQVWAADHWADLKIRQETIKVKGADDVVFAVRISRHGPIINPVDDVAAQNGDDPVAVWWTPVKLPETKILEAFYLLAHARSIDEARAAVAMIDGIGLNVMYGDREGNIAWWAAAKLIKRPDHVHSAMFLDGASGKDDPLGYYEFSENPHSENPPTGFVYSANNQPDATGGKLYPGYYVAEDRARRIVEYLASDTVWSVAAMKKMSTDCRSPVATEITAEILKTIGHEEVLNRSPLHRKAYQILQQWNGDHGIYDVAPTLYYKLFFSILEHTFADELGADDFRALASSSLLKRTLAVLVKNDASLWWDNVQTTDRRETRTLIFAESFDRAILDLKKQLGPDISAWHWGKVHTLEHPHLLGRRKPLDRLFNVGPFPAMGGNNTIANLEFKYNSEGRYPVYLGPAMRIIVDLGDIENSLSVNPTGQSGHFLSAHYADQAALFNSGEFRKQMMNRDEIKNLQQGTLILKPE
jgi:penicillin amidase